MIVQYLFVCPYGADEKASCNNLDAMDAWVNATVPVGDYIWMHPIQDDVFGVKFLYEKDQIAFKLRFGL